MMDRSEELLSIYKAWKKKAIDEGFKLHEFGRHVNRFIDPLESEPETWAIVGKLAYKALKEEKYDS